MPEVKMSKSKRFLAILIFIFSLIGATFSISFLTSVVHAEDNETSTLYSIDYAKHLKVSCEKFKDNRREIGSKEIVENNSYILFEKAETLNEGNLIDFKISSNVENKKFITSLQVNAFLNGEQIVVDGFSSSRDSYDDLMNFNANLYCYELNFTISLDSGLKYMFKFNESNERITVDNLQGHYEIYFSAQISDTTSSMTYNVPDVYNWLKYDFTIIDQSNYSNAEQMPTFENTETKLNEENSYYFTQEDTKFAYLKFDAENFKLKVKRSYEAKENLITSEFYYYTDNSFSNQSLKQTNFGRLFFHYPNNKIVSFNIVRNGLNNFIFDESQYNFNSNNCQNYSEPLFYDLGEYTIEYFYQIYQNGELLYDDSENSSVKIDPIKLYIYGFNLNYAHNITENKKFINFNAESNTNDTSTILNPNFKKGTTISNLTTSIIPSTNQAPIWFNCLATSPTILYNNYNSLSALTSASTSTLAELNETFFENTGDKNTTFTESGYYLIYCKYSYSELADKSQFFIFQIKNNTPAVSIYSLNQNTNAQVKLNNNGYTNQSVFIQMDKLGVFDSRITTEYSLNTEFNDVFRNYTQFNVRQGLDNNFTKFTQAGKYSIKVTFGINSCSYYIFNIDTDNIKNYVSAWTVTNLNSSTLSSYIIDENISNKHITNKPFTLSILQKPSKSPISATLTTIDVETNSSYSQSTIYNVNDEEDTTFVYSKYIATYASSPSKYDNIINMASNTVSSNYVFSNHKIYIFEISDASGYNYVHIMYLDNSKANILQFDKDDNLANLGDFNIVSSKTTMKWAKYKALEFSPSTISERNQVAYNLILNNFTNNSAILDTLFKRKGSTLCMLIPFTNVKVSSTELNGTKNNTTSGDIYDTESDILNKNEMTIYGTTNIPTGVNGKFIGEKLYTIELEDLSGNITSYKIEVNMDKSLGKMFTLDKDDKFNTLTSENKVKKKLFLEQAGSDEFLTFEWKDEESGAFKIYSLTYEFYPLTLDTSSNNYPYASEPTKSGDLLVSAQESADMYFYSDAINPISTLVYTFNPITQKVESKTINVTEAGKYIITRTYTGSNEDVSDEGDEKIREYIYFVDRNPIIQSPTSSSPSAHKLGESINLEFGNNRVKFNEFYREKVEQLTINNSEEMFVALESNLLPIKINVPKNKYNYLTSGNLQGRNLPFTFDLSVVLEKYSTSGRMEKGYPKVYNTVGSNGYIDIPEIVTSGWYRMRIQDNALEPNNQLSPMSAYSSYFAFYVKLSSPEAEVKSSNNTSTIIAGDNPLNMHISGNKYVYTYNQEIIKSINKYSRKLDVTQTSNFPEFSSKEELTGGSFSLDIIDINDKSQYYQYKFEVIYFDESKISTTHFSPLLNEYDTFDILSNEQPTKDNLVIFTFDEVYDSFNAQIDTNDIRIVRYEKVNNIWTNQTVLIKNRDFVLQERPKLNGKILYSIELYKIDTNNPTKEYRYEVTYHYLGSREHFTTTSDNGTVLSYYSSTKNIVIDKSAPTYNLVKIANDYNAQSLSTFNKRVYSSSYYNSSNNTYYYANVSDFDFIVSGNFKFSKNDCSQIYIRKYSKYNEQAYIETDKKNRAYQSLIPGDPNFVNGNTSLLRFNPMSELWYSLNIDADLTFAEQINNYASSVSHIEDKNGFYEIIEVDEVGNHTIYTVLYSVTTPTLTFIANTQNGEESKEINATENTVDSYNNITLSSINSIDSYIYIVVDKVRYEITPEKNKENIISQINNQLALISQNFNTATGISINVILSNRFGNDISFVINLSDPNLTPNITIGNKVDNLNEVIFNNDTNGLKLKSVKVLRFDTTQKTFVKMENDFGKPIDSEGKEIVLIGNANRTYLFENGIYKFMIEDNFRKEPNPFIITKNIGLGDNTYNLTYSASKTYINSIAYTTGNVTLNANTNLYQVTATRNGENIDISTESYVFYAPPVSLDASTVSGDNYVYEVRVFDITTGEIYVEKFVINNVFPAIKSQNSKGDDMNKILATSPENVSTFSSDSIWLYWTTSSLYFPYTFTINYYESLTGALISSSNVSGSGVTVSNKGAYELKITNRTLKNTRSLWFVLRESSISMYSVSEKLENNQTRILTEASTLLDASNYKNQITQILESHGKTFTYNTNMKIKNYFSIYDFEITVDGDKGLNTNWGKISEQIRYNYNGEITNCVTYIVLVYGISPYNYLDIFAVTKITPNSRFLEKVSYSYEKQITDEQGQPGTEIVPVNLYASRTSTTTIYENPVKLKWSSFFAVPQNKIIAKLYFNGTFVKEILGSDNSPETSITLVDDGRYSISFSDLAGNKMLWGDSSSSDLTLTIVSTLNIHLNNEQSVYGKVYNQNVLFEVLNPTNYNGLDVVAFRNGENIADFKITKNTPSYLFTKPGYYSILVNGSITTGISTETSTSIIKQLQTKNIIFTIINPNESKFAYEFSGINGYEITKVLRNGYDITDELKGSSTGIYSLVLSEQINGIGKYNITIKANFLNSLKPSEEFNFDVWINNKTPMLNCNIKNNTISVPKIVFTYNPLALYEQLGECKIVVGDDEYLINEKTVQSPENQTIEITYAGTYYVSLVSNSGNVISVYKVTKQDPLNTLSIILIILAIAVAGVGGYLFFRLRIRMRVK